jgi:hypothetical protein
VLFRSEDYSHETYEEWMHDGGAELATLLFEKAGVGELKAERDEQNSFVMSVEDRKEAKAYMDVLDVRVKVLQAQKKVHVDKMTVLRKQIAESKVKAKEKERQHGGGQTKQIRRKIEDILKTYKIDRGAHHGGDLVGGACRLLMKHASLIFDDIKYLLLTINECDRAAPNHEIEEQCGIYTEALGQFDALLALLRIPNGKVTEADIVNARKHAKKAMESWRKLGLSVTMKAHLLEDHVIAMMARLNGIGDFMEDFIEQTHQFGDADERRSNGLRNRTLAANSHSKWEHVKNNPLVAMETAAVTKGTKRPLKINEEGRTAKMQRIATAKQLRDDNREVLRSDDHNVLGSTVRLLSAEENAMIDYKHRNVVDL